MCVELFVLQLQVPHVLQHVTCVICVTDVCFRSVASV